MKVNLTKTAVYEFNEDKFTAIPNTIFNNLVSGQDVKNEEVEAEMVFFANANDYVSGRKDYRFNNEKPVYVNEKGQVFVFIEPFRANESTDTEENTTVATQSE